MEMHQLLPNFVPGDAIGNHARALRRLLQTWGFRSEIYAHYAHPEVAQECRPLNALPAAPRGAVIYHYSTLSAEAGQAFVEFKGKRAIIYHNITPAYFYAPYCQRTYRLLCAARGNLGQFRGLVDMTLGVSAYNCVELAAAGYDNPRRLPLFPLLRVTFVPRLSITFVLGVIIVRRRLLQRQLRVLLNSSGLIMPEARLERACPGRAHASAAHFLRHPARC